MLIEGSELKAIVEMLEIDDIKSIIKNEDGGIIIATSSDYFELISVNYAEETGQKIINNYNDLALVIK